MKVKVIKSCRDCGDFISSDIVRMDESRFLQRTVDEPGVCYLIDEVDCDGIWENERQLCKSCS
jgi:hypothetical protein